MDYDDGARHFLFNGLTAGVALVIFNVRLLGVRGVCAQNPADGCVFFCLLFWLWGHLFNQLGGALARLFELVGEKMNLQNGIMQDLNQIVLLLIWERMIKAIQRVYLKELKLLKKDISCF